MIFWRPTWDYADNFIVDGLTFYYTFYARISFAVSCENRTKK